MTTRRTIAALATTVTDMLAAQLAALCNGDAFSQATAGALLPAAWPIFSHGLWVQILERFFVRTSERVLLVAALSSFFREASVDFVFFFLLLFRHQSSERMSDDTMSIGRDAS